jgi:hypothetical protein
MDEDEPAGRPPVHGNFTGRERDLPPLRAAIWELRDASPDALMQLSTGLQVYVQVKYSPAETAAAIERDTGMHAVAQLMRSPMGIALITAIVTALLTLGGELAKDYLDNLLHLTPAPAVIVKVEQPPGG